MAEAWHDRDTYHHRVGMTVVVFAIAGRRLIWLLG
jgi:hypothetical protein